MSSLRAEHDALLTSLSTRESTRHFAHGAVSGFFAMALGGSAAKLWLDWSASNPEWALLCVSVSLVALMYSVVRVVMGARANMKERVLLSRLRELRVVLQLDAPVAFSKLP